MITKLAEGLRKKEFSVRDLVNRFTSEAKAKNKELNAYLEIFDNLDEEINRAEKLLASDQSSLLAGIPLAVKDNILIKDRKVSAASRILENYRAAYDATVIKKLKEAGAIIIGRTNMDEFAMGSSTENSGFGPTKNPLDQSKVPGGSSGGSAAVVAAGMAAAAIGSDTGGSIRQPAAFCGLVGLLPTYGTVSRVGLIALASSFDQIGPITKTVTDAEIIFRTIAAYDSADSTAVPAEKRIDLQKEKKVIGVPFDFLADLNEEVSQNFQKALDHLTANNYQVKEVKLPRLRFSLPTYYIIMSAEAATNLARYDGIRYGQHVAGADFWESFAKTRQLFGFEVKRRIILGNFVLSHGYKEAYYNKAASLRAAIRAELLAALQDLDAIVLPTTPTAAFGLGEKKDPVAMYLSDIFTVAANIANLPALAVPFGQAKNGLPLSVEFIGRPFAEEKLFNLGKIMEKNENL